MKGWRRQSSAPSPDATPSTSSELVEPAGCHSEDGVDASLIQWMLGLSPLEHLEAGS